MNEENDKLKEEIRKKINEVAQNLSLSKLQQSVIFRFALVIGKLKRLDQKVDELRKDFEDSLQKQQKFSLHNLLLDITLSIFLPVGANYLARKMTERMVSRVIKNYGTKSFIDLNKVTSRKLLSELEIDSTTGKIKFLWDQPQITSFVKAAKEATDAMNIIKSGSLLTKVDKKSIEKFFEKSIEFVAKSAISNQKKQLEDRLRKAKASSTDDFENNFNKFTEFLIILQDHIEKSLRSIELILTHPYFIGFEAIRKPMYHFLDFAGYLPESGELLRKYFKRMFETYVHQALFTGTTLYRAVWKSYYRNYYGAAGGHLYGQASDLLFLNSDNYSLFKELTGNDPLSDKKLLKKFSTKRWYRIPLEILDKKKNRVPDKIKLPHPRNRLLEHEVKKISKLTISRRNLSQAKYYYLNINVIAGYVKEESPGLPTDVLYLFLEFEQGVSERSAKRHGEEDLTDSLTEPEIISGKTPPHLRESAYYYLLYPIKEIIKKDDSSLGSFNDDLLNVYDFEQEALTKTVEFLKLRKGRGTNINPDYTSKVPVIPSKKIYNKPSP